ncbi:hypothetical protein RQCS_61910 (plasmid) [Rhodococcus qingshengii]|nr:hypothetical protein RQCS_61910 [Rhodococcus qingshengii]
MCQRYPLKQRERADTMAFEHFDAHRSVYSARQVTGLQLSICAESLQTSAGKARSMHSRYPE